MFKMSYFGRNNTLTDIRVNINGLFLFLGNSKISIK